MNPDVFIESIEFKSRHEYSHYVSSVKVNLSNGESSPVFENSDWTQHSKHETIVFDPSTTIRAVEAFDVDHHTGSYVYRIRFMDGAGEEVYAYNPSNMTVRTS